MSNYWTDEPNVSAPLTATLKRSARYWTARNWTARKRAARDREQPLLPIPPAQDQKTEPKPTDLSQCETVTTLVVVVVAHSLCDTFNRHWLTVRKVVILHMDR